MIPKRIIYCWFGDKEKSENIQKCISSWKEKMPDWEYLEINENNFDINYNAYVKSAYESKKWSYVSDVARLLALYNYGGIYLDTDVLVHQPLDKFLCHKFFTGFEQPHYCVTATIGAEKGNDLIKEMLDIYNTKTFETHENWYEYETNTMILSDVLGKYFDRDKMEYQEKDNMAIYPKNVFCVLDENDKDNCYTQHLMFGSWCNK